MTVKGTAFFLGGVGLSLALGWVGLPLALYESEPQPLAFSHKAHGPDGAGMACADCHVLQADGRFAGIPGVESCAGCHAEPMGGSPEEARLVEEYVKPGREIPWHVYSRQPDNVHFPHAPHLKRAGLACEACHGPHGGSEVLPAFQRNRLSGYGRDIWGPTLSRLGREPWQGKKMTDCSACHRECGVSESCLDCHK